MNKKMKKTTWKQYMYNFVVGIRKMITLIFLLTLLLTVGEYVNFTNNNIYYRNYKIGYYTIVEQYDVEFVNTHNPTHKTNSIPILLINFKKSECKYKLFVQFYFYFIIMVVCLLAIWFIEYVMHNYVKDKIN